MHDPAKSEEEATAPRRPQGLDARGLTGFAVVTFAGPWLLAAPLYLSPRGLGSPWAALLLPAAMIVPSLGAAVGLLTGAREDSWVRATGLPLRLRASWRYLVLAWAGVALTCLAAPWVAQALGVVQLDVRHLSGFRQAIASAGEPAAKILESIPIHLLAGLQLVQSILIAPVLGLPLALGEEWGWRGYLLPKLLPLGQGVALVATGVVWGLWHAPFILLGYNYPLHPRSGVLLMTLFCVLFGVLFGWLRLAARSVWPAAVGHAVLNGGAGLLPVLVRAGAEYDSAAAGITGWTGWILPALAVTALLGSRRLPVDLRRT